MVIIVIKIPSNPTPPLLFIFKYYVDRGRDGEEGRERDKEGGRERVCVCDSSYTNQEDIKYDRHLKDKK